MKKLLTVIILFTCLFCLYGCQSEDKLFSLDENTKNSYNDKINEILKREHWNYDENTVSFEESTVPDESVGSFDEVKRVSEAEGLDFEGNKGKNAVCASVRIFHFNNEEAGKAYFYFVDYDMVCIYYVSNENIYGISQINVFYDDIFSGKAENTEIKPKFSEIDINKPFDGFEDAFWNGGIIGVIADEKVKFFKFSDSEFYIDKEIDFSKENLFPMDLSFDDGGNIAVLLGRKKKTEHEVIHSQNDLQEMRENGLTEAEINGADILAADRIVFFDCEYNNQFQPCMLEVSSYSSIDYNGGKIFASRGKGIDIFTNSNGVFSKTKQYLIKQWVEKIKSADIDGDGINEFIMTDNTNLFLYRLDDIPILLWKTHLSLKSMDRRFYIEDINGDGIKEIYVSDTYLNTTGEYALTDYGFKPISAVYQEEYIPGDFTGNGKTDYLLINNNQESCKMFLAE